MLYLVWVGYAWWLADSVFNSDLPVCQRVNHATNYHIAFCVQHDISNDFGTLRRTRIANENLLIAVAGAKHHRCHQLESVCHTLRLCCIAQRANEINGRHFTATRSN